MKKQNVPLQVLRVRLENLRNAISKGLDHEASEMFDEFIREHEFGLALHVICDHLLESTIHPATVALVEQIQALHSAMMVEDGCVAALQAKAAISNQ